MYPIWLIVDAASARLMSSLGQPMIAPNISVPAPTMITPRRASGDRLYSGLHRTIRYTPAVTIVAAWINADTGVGPSIASPSQACSGTCADLAQGPALSSSPIQVRALGVGRSPVAR